MNGLEIILEIFAKFIFPRYIFYLAVYYFKQKKRDNEWRKSRRTVLPIMLILFFSREYFLSIYINAASGPVMTQFTTGGWYSGVERLRLQWDPRLTKLTHITLSPSSPRTYLYRADLRLYRTGIYQIQCKSGCGSDRKLGTMWREFRVSKFQNVPDNSTSPGKNLKLTRTLHVCVVLYV